MNTVIIPTGWIVVVNNCPDRPLFKGVRYMISCKPLGKYRDALGGLFYQDPNHAIATLKLFGPIIYCSFGHSVSVIGESVAEVSAEIATALAKATGNPVSISGTCKNPVTANDFGTPMHHRVPELEDLRV